jgi:hypothetical protein
MHHGHGVGEVVKPVPPTPLHPPPVPLALASAEGGWWTATGTRTRREEVSPSRLCRRASVACVVLKPSLPAPSVWLSPAVFAVHRGVPWHRVPTTCHPPSLRSSGTVLRRVHCPLRQVSRRRLHASTPQVLTMAMGCWLGLSAGQSRNILCRSDSEKTPLRRGAGPSALGVARTVSHRARAGALGREVFGCQGALDE